MTIVSTPGETRTKTAWFGLVLIRSLAVLGLMFWVGGFTFYASVVLHTLEDIYGEPEAGFVTQRVSDFLNYAGLASIALCWVQILAERNARPGFWSRLRSLLLGVSTAILGFLLYWNTRLDAHLAQKGLTGFYSLHQTYLVVSVVHWAVNIGLVVAMVAVWTSFQKEPRAALSPER